MTDALLARLALVANRLRDAAGHTGVLDLPYALHFSYSDDGQQFISDLYTVLDMAHGADAMRHQRDVLAEHARARICPKFDPATRSPSRSCDHWQCSRAYRALVAAGLEPTSELGGQRDA